jgi:exopolyphosphatase/guanosine-5'-triphosphate,3'-diphosphate pyrophosphatase
MRTAGVDIGTNSVRLLVAEVGRGEDGLCLETRQRLMAITRLGEGVDERGVLNGEAMRRTADVLRDYREIMLREETQSWEVAATSAAREAANADEFMGIVREIMGKEPRVLSGEEEARLSFRGATYDLGALRPREGAILVVDIGGGSTEIIVGRDGEILEEHSVDVGCVRMSERFIISDPPLSAELREMEEYIRSAISPYVKSIARWSPQLMVGLAGTITTLSGLKQELDRYDGEAIHHSWLRMEDVEELYKLLYSLSLDARRDYMRLEPGRADVIVGGAAVLKVLLQEMSVDRFLVSEKDILDGLAITAAEGEG